MKYQYSYLDKIDIFTEDPYAVVQVQGSFFINMHSLHSAAKKREFFFSIVYFFRKKFFVEKIFLTPGRLCTGFGSFWRLLKGLERAKISRNRHRGTCSGLEENNFF